MAYVAMAMIGVLSVACGVRAYLEFDTLDRPFHGWEEVLWFLGTNQLFLLTIVLPTLVCFFNWLSSAMDNATVLRAAGGPWYWDNQDRQYALLNTVIFAYRNLHGVWRQSDAAYIYGPEAWRFAPPSWLVRGFGLNCLIAMILFVTALLLGRSTELLEVLVPTMNITGNLCLVAAGVLLIVIVYRITQRQRERFVRLHDEDA